MMSGLTTPSANIRPKCSHVRHRTNRASRAFIRVNSASMAREILNCQRIEQRHPDRGRFVQDGSQPFQQHARMLSDRTQSGNAVEHTHSSRVSVRLVESILYHFSPIGETSPFSYPSKTDFPATYGWSRNCLLVSRISFQKRIDAEDHESGERRSCLYVVRSNGRGKCRRNANPVWIGSERSPHRLGLERSNPRGSRGCPVSGQLRNRQHQDQELPSIHSRVDHQGTSGRLKLVSCPSCFWMTAVKEMLWQQQRNGAT